MGHGARCFAGHGITRLSGPSARSAWAELELNWSWTGATETPAAGKALAVRRKAKGLSQRAMAARLSVSPQTIVTLETRFTGRIVTLRQCLRALGIVETLGAPARRLVPASNDAAADVVFTPRDLAKRIVAEFADRMSGSVLEPARGDGAFYDTLPSHITRHWCEITEGRDFFDWNTPVDWIVTNPPWSRFRDFLEHSLRLADNVLFLAPINHFGTKRRVSLVSQAGFGLRRVVFVPSPAAWPASGFQLAAVWLQRGWKGPTQFKSSLTFERKGA
jgi:transcriptional regulator with XRE-family HTH domain